jgi:TonB family protein
LTLPASVVTPPEVKQHLLTPLVAPPPPLTQKEPSKAKLSGEFNAVERQPPPRVVIPPSPPQAVPAARPAPTPAPAVPVPPPIPEPPKIQAGAPNLPRMAEPPLPPPPQIEPREKPKLAFETPTAPPSGHPTGRVPIPSSAVQDAIRGVARGGPGAMVQAPAAGSRGSQVALPDLLSDPMGVDFKPYLARLLGLVEPRWKAVWPQSAKLGLSGRVSILLRISRDGTVLNNKWGERAGVEALNFAAMAGINAAMPFPPLPGDFKGSYIDIQLNFSYNVPK